MNIPKQIVLANDVLGRATVDGGLGRQEGMPRYQWLYSQHIQMPVVCREQSDDNSWYTIFDYYCGCGKNRNVHTPDCNTMTIAHARWEWANLVSGLDNHWVFCRWLPPTVWGDEQKWSSMFYGAPFPENGFYLPTTSIGPSGRHISVPNTPVGMDAFAEANRIVIKAFLANSDTTGKKENEKFEEEYRKNQQKIKDDYRYQFKQAFSNNLDGAGKKGDWVSMTMGNSETPEINPASKSSGLILVEGAK